MNLNSGRIFFRHMRGVHNYVRQEFMLESSRWFLWIPVFFGAGIAIYFSLDFEPPLILPLALFALGLGISLLTRKNPAVFPLVMAILLVAGGFLAAKLRSENVAAPVLVKRIGPVSVSGWLEHIEARAAGGWRLIVRPDKIGRIKKSQLPKRIQITARMKVLHFRPGDGIAFRAILLAPPGPARPGGFSYARMAWFKQIGASGFIVSKPEKIAAGAQGNSARIKAWISRLRAAVTARIIAGLPAMEGGMAAALVTGDKGALDPELRSEMRDSGLAHLLAISGLHMGLFGGVLFIMVRGLLALSTYLTLKYPVKKWAAVIALTGSAAYLVLSGGSIATQRAFIMISIMFVAILLNRRALSMRNVAIAAMLVLFIRPESLFSVSFQMSFAAVIALVAVYESGLFRLPAGDMSSRKTWMLKKILFYVFGVFLTSLVAGLATAPFAAYHFHRAAFYGILGNMIAVPVMGLLIMPAALCVLIAMAFGLEAYPLAIMGFGIDMVAAVADKVANLPGAVGFIAQMHPVSLPLFVLGGLWLCLWRRAWRLAGILPILIAFLLAPFADRAEIMIARQGENIAIRDNAGRLAFLKPRKSGYSARKWLEADGDRRTQRQASSEKLFSCDDLACVATLRNGTQLAYIRHMAALREECGRAKIIIANVPVWRGICNGPAYVIDKFDLRSNGATAIFIKDKKTTIRTAADFEGRRPWSSTGKKRTTIRMP